MKNLVKAGLLSVALFATAVINAADKVEVKAAAAKTVNVSLTEVTKGETFSILDRNGVVLFSETLRRIDTYAKTFDFSNLPEGVYFLENKEDKKISVTPVIVTDAKVSVVVDIAKEYIAPEIIFNEGVGKVVVNNQIGAKVSIRIYSSQGAELTNTGVVEDKLVVRAFNFNGLPADTYTVVVTADDYSFIENIEF